MGMITVFEDKYEIILSKDKEHDGLFYTAVKTTGIYCVPSCPAKTPKKENVEFFYKSTEAEAAGYRACKKCLPQVLGIPWNDYKSCIEIDTPKEFSFEECLVYLNRSDTECLHKVKDGVLYKFIKVEVQDILLKIEMGTERLNVTFLNGIPPKWARAQAAKYIFDLFDLQTDLTPFYKMGAKDPILNNLIEKYYGLRIIKINDLFECLCWAVIGQQINLKFAYTLKKRLVERYGKKLNHEGEEYFLFPNPQTIAALKTEDLQQLQFTSRKSEYIIGIAKQMADGSLNKEALEMETDYEQLKKRLISIRGIGNWTADYTIMKCFHLYHAFPLADVGIHNALKGILGMEVKPSIPEIEKLAKCWIGWESYAAFYLWRWLYD